MPGRKPARLERAGALTPRDLMWAAMRELPAGFSAIEISYLVNQRNKSETKLPPESCLNYIDGLSRAKPPFIALINEELGESGRRTRPLWQWRLLRDVGVDTPRVTRDGKPVTQGAGNEAMWRAMKALGEFDSRELVQAASAGAAVTLRTADMYCSWLVQAGYLTLVSPNNGPHAKARYRFNRSMNTGPRAPLLSAAREIIDGNTGAVVYERKGEKGCKART